MFLVPCIARYPLCRWARQCRHTYVHVHVRLHFLMRTFDNSPPQSELVRTIASLPEHAHFNCIAFSEVNDRPIHPIHHVALAHIFYACSSYHLSNTSPWLYIYIYSFFFIIFSLSSQIFIFRLFYGGLTGCCALEHDSHACLGRHDGLCYSLGTCPRFRFPYTDGELGRTGKCKEYVYILEILLC